MPSSSPMITPGLPSFLRSLKGKPAEASIDHLISLLKRRQIRNARPCAIATTHLLLQVVAVLKFKSIPQLRDRIMNVGKRLVDAQPREPVIGNIISRVLGLVREVTDPDDISESEMPDDPRKTTSATCQSSVFSSSIFALMSNPSLLSTNSRGDDAVDKESHGQSSVAGITEGSVSMRDVKDDVLNGVREMLDELDQADEQIASYSLEHIHSNEVILTSTASTAVQKFLMTAAKKRKFSVIYVESYPNEHIHSHEMALYGKNTVVDDGEGDSRFKPLIAAGIKVTILPDSNIWTIMARVDKVFLSASSVFSNGGFIGAAGIKIVAQAAKYHCKPVIVLSGVYKLSPIFPVDHEEYIEYGDPAKVLDFRHGSNLNKIEAVNPIQDYLGPQLVDLYITNLGGHASSQIYRIVADHYNEDDIDLDSR